MQRLAAQMSASVGDGTKLAVILASSMIRGGREALKKGYLPKNVVARMRAATDAAVAHILTQAKPCNDSANIFNVAITASGDRDLAKIIMEAMKKIGKDGVITVEQDSGTAISLEVTEGLSFDRGFISKAFVTDMARQECILEDCHVLVYDRVIQEMREMLPLLEAIVKSDKPLLIIAENVDGEALATLAVNAEKGILKCVAIKSPGYGNRGSRPWKTSLS